MTPFRFERSEIANPFKLYIVIQYTRYFDASHSAPWGLLNLRYRGRVVR
jgi:hypothetical protein